MVTVGLVGLAFSGPDQMQQASSELEYLSPSCPKRFPSKQLFPHTVRSRWGDKTVFVPVFQMGKLESLPGLVERPRREKALSRPRLWSAEGWGQLCSVTSSCRENRVNGCQSSVPEA